MSGSVDEPFVAVDPQIDILHQQQQHHQQPHHHIHHHHHPLSPQHQLHQQQQLQQQQFNASLSVITNSPNNNNSMVIAEDSLDTHCHILEEQVQILKEAEVKLKQQYADSQRRERILARRLAVKEQEMQDYASQLQELKASQAPNQLALRSALLDPAVNILFRKLKTEIQTTKARLEETQNELSAWKFTPDSNTGKRLMAKCRLLYQENEELGKMTSNGRLAKLEGDLALQKSYSEEVKKSQMELDEFLQELDEDVEGMQSTILFLQQELKSAKDSLIVFEKELLLLKSSLDCGEKLLMNSDKLSTISCNYNRTYSNVSNNIINNIDELVRTTNLSNNIKNNTFSCNSNNINNPINLSSHSNYINGGESSVIVGGSNINSNNNCSSNSNNNIIKELKSNGGDNHNEQIMIINMNNKKMNSNNLNNNNSNNNNNMKQSMKLKRNFDSDSSECSNDNIINTEIMSKKLKKKKVRRASSVLSINLNDDDNLVDIVDGVDKSGASATALVTAPPAIATSISPTKINNSNVSKHIISMLAVTSCASTVNGNSKIMDG